MTITKKQIHFFLLLVLLTSLVTLLSCSDDRTKPDYVSHPDGWMVQSNPHFHGRVVLADTFGFAGCIGCHGVYGDGGTSGVACFDCHAYPHSGVSGWSLGFHGEYFLRSGHYDELLAGCKVCHGQDLNATTSPLGTPITRHCTDCHSN